MARRKPAPPTIPHTYTTNSSTNTGVLVASGKPLTVQELANRVKRSTTTTNDWQELAWHYYDAVGEMKFAVTLKANTLGRTEVFPAKYAGPNQPPIPLGTDESGQPTTLSKADQLALDIFNRIRDWAKILRDVSVFFSVPGECYLIGEPGTDFSPEQWNIYSRDQIRVEGEGDRAKVFIKSHSNDTKGRQLDPDTYYTALWLEHPRWRELPDSPIRGVLGSAELVLILEATARAITRSRAAAAGILKVPNELLPNTPSDQTDSPQSDAATPKPNPFLAALLAAITASNTSEGDAAQVAPMVVHGPAEYLKELDHLAMDRPFDSQLDEQMTRALTRLAAGLDMPAEIILGMGGLNHWTGWMVDESMIHVHVEPAVQRILAALVNAFYIPQLYAAFNAAGLTESPYDYTLHYNLSNLSIHPNRTRDILTAYEQDLASARSARAVLGLKETDAPNQTEILRKLATRVQIDPSLGAQILNLLFGLNLVGTEDARPENRPGSLSDAPTEANLNKLPSSRQPTPTGQSRSDGLNSQITGSANGHSPHSYTSNGTHSFIHGATQHAITSAIDRIGGRIRGTARKDKSVSAALANVPNGEVASVLGPTIASAYNYPSTDDIDLFLEPLRAQLSDSYDLPPSHNSINQYISHVASHLMTQLYHPPAHRTPFPTSRIQELVDSLT